MRFGPPNLQPLGDSIYDSIKRQQQKHVEYLAEVAKYHPATYWHPTKWLVSKAARGASRKVQQNPRKVGGVLGGIYAILDRPESYDLSETTHVDPATWGQNSVTAKILRAFGVETKR